MTALASSRTPNQPMVHPGPVAARRVDAVGVVAADLAITLEPGQEVEATLCAAVAAAGYDGAWVDVSGLHADPFAFVMPAASPDGTRVAWYSDTYAPEGETHVDAGGITVGHYNGGSFTHCHGLWTSQSGTTLGHMLAPVCTVSRAVSVKATGFKGGRFERLPDPETCFELFRACPTETEVDAPDAVIMTLRPNTDLCGSIEEVAASYGISNGEIFGLGSVNGALFRDAAPMNSAITEFIITAGTLTDGKASITLSAVDVQQDIFTGRIEKGDAAVSITAEIILRGHSPE